MTAWRLSVAGPYAEMDDVAVLGEETSSTDEFLDALEVAGWRADRVTVDGRTIEPGATLAATGLVQGSVLGLDGEGTVPPLRLAGTYLVVAAGPDAGDFLRLSDNGATVVGRHPDCDLTLSDALLSGRHLRIDVSDGAVTGLVDLESRNGTFVEDELIREHGPVEPGVAIRCGTTVLSIVTVDPDDLPVLADPTEGAHAFPRRFREALDPVPDRIRRPQPYDENDTGMRTSWWRPLLPVVSGIGLAAITGRWWFLAIIALAPIVLFLENLRRRRRDARREEAKRAAAEEAMAAFERRRVSILDAERNRRRWVAPTAGIACLHARLRTRRVWERTPSDPDFASVPVGLATMRSALRIDGSGDDEEPSSLPSVPVDVPLLATGSIAVLGPGSRVQAAVRGMLTTLATMHSPSDLQIWILSSDDRADGWSFARWLPHCFFESYGARIAQTAVDRTKLVNLLDQILTNRREERHGDSGGVVLPVHVVVLDGADVASGAQVAALLRDGPELGIIGIALDAAVVPEGVNGTVRLAELADESTFESRLQPRVSDLVLPELSLAIATAAARSLAGIRPVTSGGRSDDRANVRLLDELELVDLDPGVLVERWERASPTTAVAVGSAHGVPLVVDIVRNGPHGLVGGTTRSGKTEFLKTLFAALALANTPDDLAIIIVDFKGGVDHTQSERLPHVISLSTNADPDGFQRTVTLIVAEQERRQAVFRDAGAQNLDVYNKLREHRGDLAPVPRLLLVVDEFSELLDSEAGREQLRTLESVTRIGGGLGLHLLLVTQNFQNQLPDQIAANAGLRVCFRVQEPVHSKAVLSSGIAATLPHSRPGRAFARFHGGDLVEFQSARVANRRSDLARSSTPVQVLPVPLGAVTSTTVEIRPDDVPEQDSDFAKIIDAANAAADLSGSSGSSIPWPAELPVSLSLVDVLPRSADGIPIGLVDRPDQMTQPVFGLDGADEQTLLVGGAQAGLPEALATIVTSFALDRTPTQLHIYAIDLGDGTLSALADLPHTGGVAVRDDAMALKVLRTVSEEVARRRALFAAEGVSNRTELALRGTELPDLLMVVSDAHRLLTQSEGTVNPVLAPLLRLSAELGGTGARLLLSGSSSVAHHRLGTQVPRRLVFRIPDVHEYSGLGVPRALMPQLDAPLRAVDVNNGHLVQIAALTHGVDVATADVVRAVGASLTEIHDDRRGGPPPVVDLKWPLPADQFDEAALDPPPAFASPLPFGIEVDTGHLVWLDAEEDGPVLGIAGGPKSGRSGALLTVAQQATEVGWTCVALPASRRSPLWRHCGSPFVAVLAASEAPDSLPPRPTGPVAVMIDDAHRISSDDLGLGEWLESPEPTVVLLAGTPEFLAGRTSFLRTLPALRAGMVLAPSSSGDARGFGAGRLPETCLVDPRPGRGLYVVGGEVVEVQLPEPRFAG